MHYCLIVNFLVNLPILFYSITINIMDVFINLPPYLRAWFLCFGCGFSPENINSHTVGDFPKGSIERNILRISLRGIRKGETPAIALPEGWTRVRIPAFKGINPDFQNYLPDKGRIALESAIRSRFDNDLWLLIKDCDFKAVPLKDMLELWMDARGIEITDTNYQAVAQRAVRLRRRVYNSKREFKEEEKKID